MWRFYSVLLTFLLSLSSQANANFEAGGKCQFPELPGSASGVGYIGDSQSASSFGLFGRLAPVIKTSGHSLSGARAICGATVRHYLVGGRQSPCSYKGITHMNVEEGEVEFIKGKGHSLKVDDLLPNSKTILVQLGDNFDFAEDKVRVQELARRIIKKNRKCIWIGPAAADVSRCKEERTLKKKKSDAIRNALNDPKFIEEMCGRRCDFIDSFSKTEKNPPEYGGKGNCIHYSEYQTWASSIQEDLLSKLASPVPTASPSGMDPSGTIK